MDKGMKFDYVAFYDLDHTILVDNSATHLINEARKRGMMSSKHFRHAVWLSILYKLNIGDPTKMITRMLSWLKGLDEKEITRLCLDVFTGHMIDKIRPEIKESIADHKSRNGAVVLLSSASEPICKPVTEHLDMDDLVCSQLEARDGFLTGRTRGKLVYAREKATRLISYCKTHGFNRKTAYYYGDSFTDKFVMKEVGNPVAVDPDKRLLKIALENSWPIMARSRA